MELCFGEFIQIFMEVENQENDGILVETILKVYSVPFHFHRTIIQPSQKNDNVSEKISVKGIVSFFVLVSDSLFCQSFFNIESKFSLLK